MQTQENVLIPFKHIDPNGQRLLAQLSIANIINQINLKFIIKL